MSKSHATGWMSDAPTPAQMKEFFSQVESGRITQARLQMLLGNQPLPETVHVSGVWQTKAYRGIDAIEHHLKEGGFCQQRHFGVDDINYPQESPRGYYLVPVQLLYFGRNIGNDEALREFERMGFEPIGPAALLGLITKHPKLLRFYDCIAALGQFYFGRYRENKPPENLAVCVNRERGVPEAWAFPEDIWSKNNTGVLFAVTRKGT